MPSHLRLNTVIDTQSTQSYYPSTSLSSQPAKKQRMSLTQTYRIASSARTKLGREAARSDHRLRMLVGHANLLDSLMVELADVEREQESYFNESLRRSAKPEAPRHVQWVDTIAEEEDDEESDSDSDSDSDIYEEDFPAVPAARRASSPPPGAYTLASLDEEDEDVEDFDFNEEHALTRTESHPPELIHEDSEDSDDDSMPPSPPQTSLQFDNEQRQALDTSAFFQKAAQRQSSQPSVVSDDLFMAGNQMVAAY